MAENEESTEKRDEPEADQKEEEKEVALTYQVRLFFGDWDLTVVSKDITALRMLKADGFFKTEDEGGIEVSITATGSFGGQSARAILLQRAPEGRPCGVYTSYDPPAMMGFRGLPRQELMPDGVTAYSPQDPGLESREISFEKVRRTIGEGHKVETEEVEKKDPLGELQPGILGVDQLGKGAATDEV